MRHDRAMGPLDYERIENEFYPTPQWCTYGLMEQADFFFSQHRNIWEPAAGKGDISLELTRSGHSVVSSDLVCYDTNIPIESGRDFLAETKMQAGTTAIVTNPPYGKENGKTLSDAFVRHALDLTKPVNGLVAMLLRNEFDSAKGRRDIFQRHPAYAAKLVLTSRPRWFPDSTGSPRHNYAWFIWDWSKFRQTEPVIRYIFK
jgi:hypothetical protein